MNEQKTLTFDFKKNYSSDDYYVTESNNIAYKLLLNKNSNEQYICLKGPPKSGKTHLGSMWQKVNNAVIFKKDDYDKILYQKNNIFYDNLTLNLDEENLFHLILMILKK